jgi:hypothetical protein
MGPDNLDTDANIFNMRLPASPKNCLQIEYLCV